MIFLCIILGTQILVFQRDKKIQIVLILREHYQKSLTVMFENFEEKIITRTYTPIFDSFFKNFKTLSRFSDAVEILNVRRDVLTMFILFANRQSR